MKTKNEALQELCREYLFRLKIIASKHGLGEWVENIIQENKNHKCNATEDEVEILSCMLNEERISRKNIPEILGKSYRKCNEDEDFDKIKKLQHAGIYSRVSTILYKTTCMLSSSKSKI